MLGPRLTTVFTSRWKALWWAGSILLFAWSVVPEPNNQAVEKPAVGQHDPWASDPGVKE